MTLKQIREALALREGGIVQAWEYSVSHQWLTIRVTAPSLTGNFHLRCGDCDRAEFDTYWSPASLTVEMLGEGFLVHDSDHLRVVCGIVEGVFNVAPCFS